MSAQKALVVIDMQNDYLWPERKPKFSYNTQELVGNVNRAIHKFQEEGCDIIYITQIFPNIITNRWFIGFSIKGTEGAKIYPGIDIVSPLLFDKNFPNTYTAKAFREHMQRGQYTEVYLCGVDECGCVGATAKGAAKTGVHVIMLENAIGRRFPDAKVQKLRKALRAKGVEYRTI